MHLQIICWDIPDKRTEASWIPLCIDIGSFLEKISLKVLINFKMFIFTLYVHKCTDKWCDILIVKWKTRWNHIYRYILCILTSYVKKSTPELEEALLLVRSLRGTCTSNDVLIFWLYCHLLYKYLYMYKCSSDYFVYLLIVSSLFR